MSSSFRDTFWMLFCSRKKWADRLGSRRVPSTGGLPSEQLNNPATRFTIVRRSTDPSADKSMARAPAVQDRQLAELRPSSSPSSSLLSEPPPDPPQARAMSVNGVPTTKETAEGRGRPRGAEEVGDKGRERQRGEKDPQEQEQQPLSPTETLLGETIFL